MDRGRTLSVADAEPGAVVRSARNGASEGGGTQMHEPGHDSGGQDTRTLPW